MPKKIIIALFVYNERKYLPTFIKYYKRHGLQFLFLDNMSTDGTYEYLIKRKFNVYRIDTLETFHLKKLQRELTRLIYLKKPDWVVYAGADLYYSFNEPIKKTIEKAEKRGYNQLRVQCLLAYNTGEEFTLPLHKTYRFGAKWHKIITISKFYQGFELRADSIALPGAKPKTVNGVVINYGGCKPAAEREQTYARRVAAWKRGLHRALGSHYVRERKRGWMRDKQELLYLPSTPYWKYIEKI